MRATLVTTRFGKEVVTMGRDRKRRGGRRTWTEDPPRVNEINRVTLIPGSAEERERAGQDFVAGTVFAAGAGAIFPTDTADSGPSEQGPPPLFVVFVKEESATWGPAPGLRQLFRLLDRHGAVGLGERATYSTAWSVLDDAAEPLAKLKVEILAPQEARGRFEVVLLAGNYRDVWQHVVHGGMLGITSFERMAAATGGADASYASGLESCVLMGVGASPGIGLLMGSHGWPGL